jgi:hypothetical protein
MNTGTAFLGLALCGLFVASYARFVGLPRFLVRFMTPTVTAPSAAELEADRKRSARILQAYGQQLQAQEDAAVRERRRVHPIVTFERELAQGRDTQRRIRLAKRTDEVA